MNLLKVCFLFVISFSFLFSNSFANTNTKYNNVLVEYKVLKELQKEKKSKTEFDCLDLMYKETFEDKMKTIFWCFLTLADVWLDVAKEKSAIWSKAKTNIDNLSSNLDHFSYIYDLYDGIKEVYWNDDFLEQLIQNWFASEWKNINYRNWQMDKNLIRNTWVLDSSSNVWWLLDEWNIFTKKKITKSQKKEIIINSTRIFWKVNLFLEDTFKKTKNKEQFNKCFSYVLISSQFWFNDNIVFDNWTLLKQYWISDMCSNVFTKTIWQWNLEYEWIVMPDNTDIKCKFSEKPFYSFSINSKIDNKSIKKIQNKNFNINNKIVELTNVNNILWWNFIEWKYFLTIWETLNSNNKSFNKDIYNLECEMLEKPKNKIQEPSKEQKTETKPSTNNNICEWTKQIANYKKDYSLLLDKEWYILYKKWNNCYYLYSNNVDKLKVKLSNYSYVFYPEIEMFILKSFDGKSFAFIDTKKMYKEISNTDNINLYNYVITKWAIDWYTKTYNISKTKVEKLSKKELESYKKIFIDSVNDEIKTPEKYKYMKRIEKIVIYQVLYDLLNIK